MIILKIFENFWHYTKETSVWILVGFLFSGILRSFINPKRVFRLLEKGKISSIVMTTILSIRLPLCSCSVIPTGAALYKSGSSKASTLAFFISTPVATVTTMMITFGMLGKRFMITKIVTSFFVAFLVGLFALWFLDRKTESKKELSYNELKIEKPFLEKMKDALHFGFVETVDNIGIPMVVGLFGAGVVSSIFPKNFIVSHFGAGIFPLFFVALFATPIYICSQASAPFVAALINEGFHPSAGLVFLIAGPATNFSTIFSISKIICCHHCKTTYIKKEKEKI